LDLCSPTERYPTGQAEAAKLLGIIEFTSHYAEVTDFTKKKVLRHGHGYWLIVINRGQ
jgi:hypothetical protein